MSWMSDQKNPRNTFWMVLMNNVCFFWKLITDDFASSGVCVSLVVEIPKYIEEIKRSVIFKIHIHSKNNFLEVFFSQLKEKKKKKQSANVQDLKN